MNNLITNILIVDDVEANLLSFKAILSMPNVNIYEASNGHIALKTLIKEKIDIVLLDVQMPEINGFEVAQLMRENPKTMDIPIIFITAINKEDSFKFKGYELGAVDYLYKPIDSKLLRSKVNVFIKLSVQSKVIVDKSKELEKKVIELEAVQKELYNLTCIDQLTGVMNRRGFDDNFDMVWRRALRNKEEVTLLMIDIDYFKNYNDTYGHIEGDRCLVTVAKTIDETLYRPYDKVVRYGGEEFVVILPETDITGGIKIAGNICKAIEELNIENKMHETSTNNLTVSIGVATVCPDDELEQQQLVLWADKAMYEAKQGGRNRFCFYSSKL